MLQAYALQSAINRNGCDCLIISHDRFSTKIKERAGQNCRKFGKLVKSLVTGAKYPRSLFLMGASQTRPIKRGKQIQKAKCSSFREKFFPNKTEIFYYTSEQIMKDPPVCDAYVCGSDQIWNPERFQGAGPFYLDFAPKDRNRIAYAPSVAMTYIPDAMKKRYRCLISQFADVSVREQKGCAAIEEATGIRPEWVMDPTFLLSKEDWESFSDVQIDAPERYVFCYFLGKENLLRSRKSINRIAKDYGAKVIVLPFGRHKADRKWLGSLNVGPQEFVALIRNAQYILTDSFHGTSISILLNKNFSVYSGMSTATYANRYDRIANILNICGLESREYTGHKNIDITSIDYSKVNACLNPMINRSQQFLNCALDKVEKKGIIAHAVPKLAPYEACTGCSACYAACPCRAITMKPDQAGFWRPYIDNDKCVHCGKCETKCPIMSPLEQRETQVDYRAVYSKDKDFRMKGSSGNAFGLFAQRIMDYGGEVFGAVLSEDCRTLTFQSASKVGLDRLQKSKYFEARMGDVIHSIDVAIASGKKAMFTGTPCQAAGVRKYFGGHPDLLICDFICHGITSAEWYGRYLTEMEKKYGAKVTDVAFRSKALGWRLYCMKIDFANGKEYLKTRFADPYYIDFFQNKHLRTNCYNCNRVIKSCADVSFGDYWAVNVKHNMEDTDEGISIVCLRTHKGKKFFSEQIEKDDSVFVQPFEEDDVNETLVLRVRKVPEGNDVLPDKFDMNPKLGKRAMLQKIYYEYYIRRLKMHK